MKQNKPIGMNTTKRAGRLSRPVRGQAAQSPKRIQLSRKSGFNLQKVSRKLNGLPAVNCARPSRWGNPYVVHFDPHPDYSPQTAAEAVKMHRAKVDKGLMRIKIRQELRGKNLACWCKLGEPCHVDTLLEIANS